MPNKKFSYFYFRRKTLNYGFAIYNDINARKYRFLNWFSVPIPFSVKYQLLRKDIVMVHVTLIYWFWNPVENIFIFLFPVQISIENQKEILRNRNYVNRFNSHSRQKN